MQLSRVLTDVFLKQFFINRFVRMVQNLKRRLLGAGRKRTPTNAGVAGLMKPNGQQEAGGDIAINAESKVRGYVSRIWVTNGSHRENKNKAEEEVMQSIRGDWWKDFIKAQKIQTGLVFHVEVVMASTEDFCPNKIVEAMPATTSQYINTVVSS